MQPGSIKLLTPGQLLANTLTAGSLFLWWLASQWLPPYLVPPPGEVAIRSLELLFDPSLAVHTLRSLLRVVAAMVLALLAGSGLALLAYYRPLWRPLVLERMMPGLNAFPTFGWAILAVLWLRMGETTVIFVETVILIPFVLINLWEGLNHQDDDLLEMARSFAGRRWPVWRLVVLPMLFPYLWAALRVSYGVAWKIALLAEIFGATSGLGYLLSYARSRLDTSLVFAVIVVIIIQVFIVDRLLFARWKPYQTN